MRGGGSSVRRWMGLGAVGAAGAAAVTSQVLREADAASADLAWRTFTRPRKGAPSVFSPAMLESQPEPVRRFFGFAIAPGSRLSSAAVVEMEGDFGLGTRERPRYMAMKAREALAAPDGFVWRPSIGKGPLRFAGSDGYFDGEGWTRFWAIGAIPLVRVSGGPDLARSAAVRMFAEALIWTPAALLPRPGVSWEAPGRDEIRVAVEHRGETFAIDLRLGEDGRPIECSMLRWTNANRDKEFRLQPFGGIFTSHRDFGGYTVPDHVEIGNHFGEPDYFPFFRARVTAIDFL